MAKLKFDRKEVIDKAMELFWKKGFKGCSMQQIVETTSLRPGSIYHSFGNKEGLFREAMENYSNEGGKEIRKTIESAPSTGEGICRILEMYMDESSEKDYASCFIIKTMLELDSEGGEIYEMAKEKLKSVEDIYAGYLEKEFDEKTARQRAASIMLHIFGMRVYGYQKGSKELMREAIEAGLSWLPWEQHRLRG